jgi:hypothetical protein
MVEEREFLLPLGSFLFPRIFQTFRLSLQPSKLALAFVAVIVMSVAGRLVDLRQTVVVSNRYTIPGEQVAPHVLERPTELDIYVRSGAALPGFVISARDEHLRAGVAGTLWRFGARQFHRGMYAIFLLDSRELLGSIADSVRALRWAFFYHPLPSILFFAVAYAALSFAGGATCRMAALQFARAERPTLLQAVRFGARRFPRILAAPLTPLFVVLIVGLLFISLPGLIGNLPIVGELTMGIFLPLAFVAAGLVAVFLIATAAGLHLMLPVIAYEDGDCFDAVGRSFSYVSAGLWRILFYTAVAIVYAAVCYVFVRFFAFLVLWTTYRFLQVSFLAQNAKLVALWSGPTFDNFFGAAPAAPERWSMVLAAWLVRFWISFVVGLLISFVISFYFSANSVIYALLRHRVDGTALDEVYVRAEETAAEAPAAEDLSGSPVSEPGSQNSPA